MIPCNQRPYRDCLRLSDAEGDQARHGARGDGVRLLSIHASKALDVASITSRRGREAGTATDRR